MRRGAVAEPLRVCVVAHRGHPVREPYAGGLESLTHNLARRLAERGHEVAVFAAAGADPGLPWEQVPGAPRDETALMDALAAGAGAYDVVHNHSLDAIPLARSVELATPVLTTLHTPPEPWLVGPAGLGGSTFAAVSEHTAASWASIAPSTVVPNGVDVGVWTPRPDAETAARPVDLVSPAVWTGRLVPEKAPHDALDACRVAGVPLLLAGPVSDPTYARAEVFPRLHEPGAGGPGARWVGHLDHRRLARLVRGASVAVVSPRWDEPYGLVAAEALACGTPVAAYARGGLPEFVVPEVGALAAADDVGALAAAVLAARRLDRRVARRHAERHCSLDRVVDDYVALYRDLADAAPPRGAVA